MGHSNTVVRCPSPPDPNARILSLLPHEILMFPPFATVERQVGMWYNS